jgi:VCBS repeat-containing protein
LIPFYINDTCLQYVYDDELNFSQAVNIALLYTDGEQIIPTTVVLNVSNNSPSGEACGSVPLPFTNTPPVAVADNFGIDYQNRNVLANDSDADEDTLTAILVNGPANGSLTLNPDGTFSYIPNEGFFGTDSFTYQAQRRHGHQQHRHCHPGGAGAEVQNTPPVAVDDNFGLNFEGQNVLANDTDADEDTLTAVLVNGPANGSLTLNPDGTFSYSPNEGFFGTDSFTYQATDGTDSSNTATRAAEHPASVTLNFAGQNVLANDTDADEDTLTAVLVNGPANGSLTLNPDGTFTYTPNTEFFGTDSFTYQADDGTDVSNIATVTLEIPEPPNTPPVAVDDNFGLNFEARMCWPMTPTPMKTP